MRCRLIPARAGKTGRVRRRRWCRGAHPRACGENVVNTALPTGTVGSSPRVRGKPDGIAEEVGDPRLIPARAGKTSIPGRAGHPWGAHPRACGENVPSWPAMVRYAGSSPRVRGKRRGVGAPLWRAGLIPARAGKTRGWHEASCAAAAHPRACGENGLGELLERAGDGSSPRVRGKQRGPRSSARDHGLIPARAGKTGQEDLLGDALGAHPRACGENLIDNANPLMQLGSSPRVRGKLDELFELDQGQGLIPARAGKTTLFGRSSPCCTAHPRACGENAEESASGVCCAGSSPRVRGKPDGAGDPGAEVGLIPACAGKTGRRPRAPLRRSAHPRVCGENLAQPGESTADAGSSPRVRGKPADPRRPVGRRGLIPACAGKTPSSASRRSAARAHPRVCGEN